MASNTAWQAGVDAAMGKRKKNDDGDDSSSSKSDSSTKPTGGLIGLAAGAIKAPKARNTLRKEQFGQAGLDPTQQDVGALIPQAKRGGRISKTGLIFAHRGEHIIPAGKHRSRKTSVKRTITKA